MWQRAFTLIELLVVVAIIGLLASIVITSLSSARMKARDARRLADMHTIQMALAMYYDASDNQYPSPNSDAGCGGWDTPNDGVFIPGLVPTYMPSIPHDPSKEGTCMNYLYYFYPAGYAGCPNGRYYVLGVRSMETGSHPNEKSPGWACPGRDWNVNCFSPSAGCDWVIGMNQ
jgi:prepilin-type N-terminal cleavage/methylation domain-containing protein